MALGAAALAGPLLAVLLAVAQGLLVAAERPPMAQLAVQQSGNFIGLHKAHAGESDFGESLLERPTALPRLHTTKGRAAKPKDVGRLLRLARLRSLQAWKANRPEDATRFLESLESTASGSSAPEAVVELVSMAATESRRPNRKYRVLQLLKKAERSNMDGARDANPLLVLGELALAAAAKPEAASARADGRAEGGGVQPAEGSFSKLDSGSTGLAEVEPAQASMPRPSPSPLLSYLFPSAAASGPSSPTPRRSELGSDVGGSALVSTEERPSAELPPGAGEQPRDPRMLQVKETASSISKDVAGMKAGLVSVQKNAEGVKSRMAEYEKSIDTLAHQLEQADVARDRWKQETFDHFQEGDPYRLHSFHVRGKRDTVNKAELAKFEELGTKSTLDEDRPAEEIVVKKNTLGENQSAEEMVMKKAKKQKMLDEDRPAEEMVMKRTLDED